MLEYTAPLHRESACNEDIITAQNNAMVIAIMYLRKYGLENCTKNMIEYF